MLLHLEPTPEQEDVMSLRDEHFKRLNAYRNSREYVEYAKMVGVDTTNIIAEYKRTGELPTLIGNAWRIDERIYNEFLNMLSPMDWRDGSFKMCEYVFGTITTMYTKTGDNYFCQFVDTRRSN
jgi:hypothetical protein